MSLKVNRRKIFLLVLIVFSAVHSIGQNKDLKSFEENFSKLNFKSRISTLKNFNEQNLSLNDKALYHYLYGHTYYLNSSGAGAVEHFIKARENYIKANNFDKATELTLTLAEQKRLSNYKYEDYKSILDEAIVYAQKTNNPELLCTTYKEIGNSLFQSEPNKAIAFFEKGKEIAQKKKLRILEGKFNGNIGLTYGEKIGDFKKARKYQKIALSIFEEEKKVDLISYAYINFAAICRGEKKYDSAMVYYKKAENLKTVDYQTNYKIMLYGLMARTYKDLKDYENAFVYLEKQKEMEKMVNDQLETKTIRDVNTKYETQKKELENKELKIKDQKNKLILYSFIGVFLLFVLGAYFRISYINKKKKIAEQERLIESQKLENVLKEQELHEIDKLLEGQEKERIKIANDLHDNLGSILATLKLNFQSLHKNKTDIAPGELELFSKTDELIEEAYQKVRGMAHAKNAGVIGSEGLVVAVQNIARKVAIPGKLKVQVIPFGMTERLENALEVTLFRMIQEILTNTIKHAEATEITISLTQDSDSINLIIEDNGKGFNPKIITKKDGMGLNNIEKKTEQLNGTFSIDSFEGKGTTIIIDIPL